MKGHILAITPSPALDLSGVVNGIRLNEKNYVHEEMRSPGGNAINAARILTRLKIPVVASGFLGGSTGDEIEALLRAEKVQCGFLRIQASSRINVTVSNSADGMQTRLTFPGPRLRRGEVSELFKRTTQDDKLSFLLIGGSLPEGFSLTVLNKYLLWACKQGIPTAVDSPAKVMRGVLNSGPTFIKPNLLEFQEMTGTSVARISAVIKEARKLLDRVPFVCVSSVEEGALMVTHDGVYFGTIANVPVVSTVGAGDSMTGAIVGQMYLGSRDGADLLRWGLAASAATLSEPGTAFGKASVIRELYQRTRVRRIS